MSIGLWDFPPQSGKFAAQPFGPESPDPQSHFGPSSAAPRARRWLGHEHLIVSARGGTACLGFNPRAGLFGVHDEEDAADELEQLQCLLRNP